MNIENIELNGFRYIDTESSKTIEAYFPEAKDVKRSCLAEKYGLIKNEECTIHIDLTKPIQSVEDAYARLQLLSLRKVKPNTISLDKLFENYF